MIDQPLSGPDADHPLLTAVLGLHAGEERLLAALKADGFGPRPLLAGDDALLLAALGWLSLSASVRGALSADAVPAGAPVAGSPTPLDLLR